MRRENKCEITAVNLHNIKDLKEFSIKKDYKPEKKMIIYSGGLCKRPDLLESRHEIGTNLETGENVTEYPENYIVLTGNISGKCGYTHPCIPIEKLRNIYFQLREQSSTREEAINHLLNGIGAKKLTYPDVKNRYEVTKIPSIIKNR